VSSLAPWLRPFLVCAGEFSVPTYLLAGCGAGALAAAATTPLDLIKTRLQTQVVTSEGEGPLGGQPAGGRSATAHPEYGQPMGHQHVAPGGSGGGGGAAGRGGGAVSGPRNFAPLHAHSKMKEVGQGGGGEGIPGQPVRHHVTTRSSGCVRAETVRLQYKGILDAARKIYAVEGLGGFFRGMGPRLLVHTPSVAISWTTYEVVKDFLKRINIV
jgi:hypothetical protein